MKAIRTIERKFTETRTRRVYTDESYEVEVVEPVIVVELTRKDLESIKQGIEYGNPPEDSRMMRDTARAIIEAWNGKPFGAEWLGPINSKPAKLPPE